MKLIVLAGGEGKRMWPIATDKCLLPFLGKPLLFHNLKKIKEALKPEEVIITANPESKDQISKILSEVGLQGTVVIQKEPKGMHDSILSAKDFIEGEILIVNAQDILDVEAFKSENAGEVLLRGIKVDK